MQPLKSFWNEPPSSLLTFEQERPQKPRSETVSTLHRPKNDISTFFKILQKKVSRLDKKAPAHFYTILGLVICKNHVARPLLSFNKCRKSFLSSLETFFCRNLKNVRMSFLGQCNVETVSPPGFQVLSCSKVAGFEGGLFQKLFKGYIFCFLGHLVGRYIFELPTRETNLMKKRCVSLWYILLLSFNFSRDNVRHSFLRSKLVVNKLEYICTLNFFVPNAFFCWVDKNSKDH